VLAFYRGQRGHPVGFAASCRQALLELRGDQGAATVVRSCGAFELNVNDAGCVTDIDTVDDLLRAQRALMPAGGKG